MRKWTMKTRVFTAVLSLMLFIAPMGHAAEAVAWGSRGDTVRTIQTKLKQWGYFTGTVDGVYGQQTYVAVVAFQRKNGLSPDGVVGSTTAKAMGITLSGGSSGSSGSATASGTYSNDVTLLARIVYGEARGEPYVGKVAVAAVVLNRVRHASFPNTISGVIYQPGAFDAVADGQFYLTPDDDAYRAARDAMNGWDPTYGCIYYYNPSTATSSWIWSREVRLKIGKHSFAV